MQFLVDNILRPNMRDCPLNNSLKPDIQAYRMAQWYRLGFTKNSERKDILV